MESHNFSRPGVCHPGVLHRRRRHQKKNGNDTGDRHPVPLRRTEKGTLTTEGYPLTSLGTSLSSLRVTTGTLEKDTSPLTRTMDSILPRSTEKDRTGTLTFTRNPKDRPQGCRLRVFLSLFRVLSDTRKQGSVIRVKVTHKVVRVSWLDGGVRRSSTKVGIHFTPLGTGEGSEGGKFEPGGDRRTLHRDERNGKVRGGDTDKSRRRIRCQVPPFCLGDSLSLRQKSVGTPDRPGRGRGSG